MRNVAAVTVTYGGRINLLSQTIEALKANGVGRIVVVVNDTEDRAEIYGSVLSDPFVTPVVVGSNKGSAFGFSIGIQEAMRSAGEYIFLVDDDNLVSPTCLVCLLEEFTKFDLSEKESRLALLAHRPDHLGETFSSRRKIHNNGFLGFSVSQIPKKVAGKFWRRNSLNTSSELKRLLTAPYSGLFFHRRLVEFVGLPNEQLALYADDSEFTYRINLRGGLIVSVSRAEIVDLEKSWNVGDDFGSAVERWLKGRSDFRAYYSARNRIWFEKNFLSKNRFMWRMNQKIYMAVLKVFSIIWGKADRFLILKSAALDADAGRLGIHPKYPLK